VYGTTVLIINGLLTMDAERYGRRYAMLRLRQPHSTNVRASRSPERQESLMTVYRGVIKDKTVVFEEPVDLADGVEVEVHVIDNAPNLDDEQACERAFLQHLLDVGLISHLPTGEPDPPGLDRTPIEILDGPPESQTIIEERR
jgi:hypothetical protein